MNYIDEEIERYIKILKLILKSIYQRKYHFQNKIEEANKKFNLNLSADDKYELYKKLMKINKESIKKINKKFKRKRLINIFS